MSEKKLPDGWEMSSLGQVAVYINGRAFKPAEWENIGLPIIRIQNLNDENAPYNYSQKAFEKKFLIQEGDLLFAWSASLGAHIWKRNEAWLNQHIFKVEPNSCINKMFLFYHLKQIIAELYSKTHGSGMVHITKVPFLQTQIPLPPLPEQERIVAKIEELFSELDNGAASLKKIKEQIKTYRQSVLKSAFAGRLTEEWRNSFQLVDISSFTELLSQNRVSLGNKKTYSMSENLELHEVPVSWRWANIGDVVSGVEYGSAQKSSKTGLVPVVRMGNIQNCKLEWDDLVYSSDTKEIEKYILRKDDVLFNRTNSPELVGKAAIYNGETRAIFAGYLIRLNQLPEINPRYLNYYLNSPIAKQYGNMVKTDGVNQSNINGTKLCGYPFPLTVSSEQDKIVAEIESRFSVCDSVETIVDESLKKSEALRQAVLKKAFAGKLA